MTFDAAKLFIKGQMRLKETFLATYPDAVALCWFHAKEK